MLSRRLFIFFILGLIFLFQTKAAFALGLGLCHYVQGYPQYVNWAYNGGETYGWGYLQPTSSTDPNTWRWRGYWDNCGLFHPGIDDDIDWAKTRNKKIWIQILTSSVGNAITIDNWVAPRWAEEAGVEVIRNSNYPNFGYYDTRMGPVATIWDPEFLQYFEEALKVLAARYDNNDTVEAVNIMGGGGYGEMSLKPRNCETDIQNPNHPLVVSLARAWGKRPEELTANNCFCNYYYRGAPANCRCFDYYFIKSVNRIIDLYMKHFKNKPAVLQLGNGLSCMGWVTAEVVRYANCKWGNRIWTKFNGWGPLSTTFPSGDARYSFTGLEPGNIVTRTDWRNDAYHPGPNGELTAGSDRIPDCFQDIKVGTTRCIQQRCPACEIAGQSYYSKTDCEQNAGGRTITYYDTLEKCEEYGRRRIEGLVNSTIFNSSPVYLCLQGEFFENPGEYYFGRENCNAPGIATNFCIRKLNEKFASAPIPISRPADDCAVIITPEGVPPGMITPNPSPPPINPAPTATCPPAPSPLPTGATPTGGPTPDRRFNLDGDQNNQVNQADLDVLLFLWDPIGSLISPSPADFNQDGKINEVDLLTLLVHWSNQEYCASVGGICCTDNYGFCVPPRKIYPWNPDATRNDSGGCGFDKWCCSGCRE